MTTTKINKMKTLSKELSNNELIELYNINKSLILKNELVYRAKNQKPFIYSDGKPSNIELINFVKTI